MHSLLRQVCGQKVAVFFCRCRYCLVFSSCSLQVDASFLAVYSKIKSWFFHFYFQRVSSFFAAQKHSLRLTPLFGIITGKRMIPETEVWTESQGYHKRKYSDKHPILLKFPKDFLGTDSTGKNVSQAICKKEVSVLLTCQLENKSTLSQEKNSILLACPP